MKQQMLKAALLALTLTGAAMADAQPFTLNTGYKFPTVGGITGYSLSQQISTGTYNRYLGVVHGDGGNGYQYMVGAETVSGSLYIRQNSASNGGSVTFTPMDIQTYTLGTAHRDDAYAIAETHAGNYLYIAGASDASSLPTIIHIPFLAKVDIAAPTPSPVNAVYLPIAGTSGEAVDVTTDLSDNVYVLVHDDASGGQFDIFKYDSGFNLIAAFYSITGTTTSIGTITGQGLAYNAGSCFEIKVDDATNNLYICGVASPQPGYSYQTGFLANLDLNLNYNTSVFRFSGNTNFYITMDVDPANNEIVVIGRENFTTFWETYSFGLSSTTPTHIGMSTVNGKAGSDGEAPLKLLIDDNSNYILFEQWFTATDVYDYITYINRPPFPASWDVYYGSSAYAFLMTTSYPYLAYMHKDNSGTIVLNGENTPANYFFTLSLNNPTASSGWSHYENKHTAVTNVTTANGFSVYPNPAQNELNISLPADGAYTCRIMNSLGQLMASQNISDGKQAAHINITSLAAGQYYVQLQQSNKTVGTTAFVKE